MGEEVHKEDIHKNVDIKGGNGITAGRDVIVNAHSSDVIVGNITQYVHTEAVEDRINELIEFAKFCTKKKEYKKALEFYDKAKSKLEYSPSDRLFVKVIVGEAVCHHKKGNFGKAKKLILEAELVDPENPIVLADLASLLRIETPERAETYAKKALELDQNNVLAMCTLGLLESERGNTKEGLRKLREASVLNPNDAYPIYCMSHVHSFEGDYDNAIKLGLEAIGIEPEDSSYHNALGILYLKASSPYGEVFVSYESEEYVNQDYIEEAIKVLEKARDLNDSQGNYHLNSEIYVNLGCAYLAKNEIDMSIDFLNKALDSGLDCADVYIKLGEAYAKNQNCGKVIEYYQPLIENDDITGDELFVVKANLAGAYAAANKLDEAEALFDELIKQKPTNPHLHIDLAKVAEIRGDFEKAIDVLNRISDVPQNLWEYNYIKGRLNHKINDYEQAAIHFKESIKSSGGAREPTIGLINLYIDCGMHEHAIKYAEKLVETDIRGIDLYNLATLYYSAKDYKMSADFSRKALDAGYNDLETYRLLCISLLEAHDTLSAKLELESASSKFPDDLELKLIYTDALIRLNEDEKAVAILNDIIQCKPAFTPAHLSLANIYLRNGSYEKALELAKKASILEPKNEHVYFVWGNCLLKLGKVDEATEKMIKVSELNPDFEYTRFVKAEEFITCMEHQAVISQRIIENYENGSMTISKVAEILNKETIDLLNHINNYKVSEYLGLSDEKIDQLNIPSVVKKNVLLDDTILGILITIDKQDLLKLAFNHVYITKELEKELINNTYGEGHPWWQAKKTLKIFQDGWIEGLRSSEISILATKKIFSEKKLSKKDISFVSLSLDNDCLCMTEDLLLRTYLERMEKPTCGIVGLLNYLVHNNLIKNEEVESIHKSVKSLCEIDFKRMER
ncbi:hypothetical protein MSMTP_1830 [Methanosarcina sp. MTP4]|uniref:tetratricopeptide repeat protein n=1 Tax=Methanosarcina sp. MTP4 TaxID=1434100 RepID=UPI000615D8E6|nr:tetratricopeptide repeat protein [Methanosarcina sp. MTP4]AKB25299.1 hypothetical protein MSMTP_1830 [Methanosarcina sp. MTP4]